MMSGSLPLWFGRERGTDIAALVDFEVDDTAEDTGGRDLAAGMLGLLLPVAVIAGVMGSGQLPIVAMVVLSLAGAAWLAAGIWAAWLVASSDAEAPAWAEAAVAVLVGLGHIIIIAVAIATVVTVLLLLVTLIVGLASSDRR